ncbi:MAG: tetratricopeptide repeat protein [Planctomycetota bacterium]|nr:tetratricopeptide repeat protein [Planctomycetota bacterium]
MKSRQYNDAIKVLLEDVRGKAEAGAATQYLMLGECYYLTKQFDQAKTCLIKAAENLTDENDKAAAAFRLACTAYRMNDYTNAAERIDAFCKRFPNDQRAAKLLVFKMAILANRGKDAQGELESLHQRVQADLKKNGYATGMEADAILTEFYRKTGQPEKAEEILTRVVLNFRHVIAEYQQDKLPIPAGLEKYHDNAAIQLGVLCIEKKRYADAAKWLENVRYDPELKMKARLLLAKAAYEQQDYGKAMGYLNDKAFLDTVPDGPLKHDIYLVLGMCEKSRKDSNAAKVEEYLKKVGAESRGYAQAQCALGEIYREHGVIPEAVKAYTNALGNPEHAATALFNLGCIAMDEASKTQDQAAAAKAHQNAAAHFGQLIAKYPLSAEARQAREKVQVLLTKGVDVGTAASGDDGANAWQKTAEQKKGSAEGAQALMSLMRYYARQIVDEKTKKVVQAPNNAACAGACDRLLDESVYTGKGLSDDAWKALRTEILYQRGVCELASVGTHATAGGRNAPTYLEKADAEKALRCFEAAKRLVDPKRLDMVKQIEIGLLEAMFKSERKEDKAAAEKRFGELENDFGADPRFQRLAVELAEWYRQQGRYAEAAKAYEGVADRGRELGDEDLLKALYMAGSLYSKAAYEAQQKKGETSYGIYVYPAETLAIGDDLLKTYRPLQKEVTAKWPRANMTARDALVYLSKLSGVPFVWSPQKGKDSVAEYVETRRVTLRDGKATVAQFLSQILDLSRHRLALDIGLTDGQPTLREIGGHDPNSVIRGRPGGLNWESCPPISQEEASKPIEIYDEKSADKRFAPLTCSYGAWDKVHRARERQGVMLHTVLARVEELGQTRILWAEGIEKDAKLAAEFKQAPAALGNNNVSCAKVLAAALAEKGLRYRIVPRDVSTELYERAKDAFNKIRRVDPKSKYGEKSLFALALNFYNQNDYAKMKAVLREYLKVFDSPGNEYYYHACFWLGWVFEYERKFHDACAYYARAAEESLVLYKPAAGEALPPKEELKKRFSYDLLFALSEQLSGQFKDMKLADFADFVHLNSHVAVRLDPSAQAVDAPVNRDAFKNVAGFDVLCEVLQNLGLSVRGENVQKEIAEKAYFRLATVYAKDNLMEQALENCNALLTRFPNTPRKKDIYALKLDIYKGLKDYRNVLAALDELKALSGSDLEQYKFDLEMASIHFDLCNYKKAAELYRSALASVKDLGERAGVQEAYARSLFRDGDLQGALAQYSVLVKEDTTDIGQFTDRLMVFCLNFALDKAAEREFPEDAQRFILEYEKLSDGERQKLPGAALARATWIYYVMALVDLKKGRTAEAIQKLAAASNSPDEALAGEASYLVGATHLAARSFDKAKEAFEYVLFTTRSTEASVKATYALGLTFQALDLRDKARERFKQIVERYPLSPYVELIRKNPLYQETQPALPEKPAGGDVKPQARPNTTE